MLRRGGATADTHTPTPARLTAGTPRRTLATALLAPLAADGRREVIRRLYGKKERRLPCRLRVIPAPPPTAYAGPARVRAGPPRSGGGRRG